MSRIRPSRIGSVALATAIMAATPALAVTPVPTVTQDLTVPAPDTANTASIWADAIQENNKFFTDVVKDPPKPGRNASFVTQSYFFHEGDTQVFYSVALSGKTCDDGNLDDVAYQECDARIAVVRNGKVSVHDVGRQCYVTNDTGSPDIPGGNTYAALSADGKSIKLSASVAGKAIPECSVVVDIP